MVDIKLLQSLNEVFTHVMKTIFLTPSSSADETHNDMTWSQKKILMYLADAGPSKMSDIARQVGVTMSAATAIVDKMVRGGLVLREMDPGDRRVVRIVPSGEGKAVIAECMNMQVRCFEEVLERLEPEKRTELLEAFRKIHTLLSEIQLPAPGTPTPLKNKSLEEPARS